MVMYELLAHQIPWGNTETAELIKNVLGGQRPHLPESTTENEGLITLMEVNNNEFSTSF